jgi:hypothetical protein
LRLAALSAWSRRLTLGLTLVAIALAVTLLLAVERLRVSAQRAERLGIEILLQQLPALLQKIVHGKSLLRRPRREKDRQSQEKK